MGIVSGHFVCRILCHDCPVCPRACGKRGDACALHPFSHSHSHSDGQTLALHFLSTFSSLEPGHTEVKIPDLHLLYSLPYIKNTFHAVCCCTDGMYLRAPPVLSSYWEFEEHSINFLGANNEKIYQFADGSGMRSCQLYYCIR